MKNLFVLFSVLLALVFFLPSCDLSGEEESTAEVTQEITDVTTAEAKETSKKQVVTKAPTTNASVTTAKPDGTTAPSATTELPVTSVLSGDDGEGQYRPIHILP